MTRINTNISSVIARNNLDRSNRDLGVRLERLSTGLQINRGADNPAGLIVSERLRSEIRGIEQAITNSERASSVIATTEGYLAEVAELLNSIKSLVVESANTGGLSEEEIEANQLQVDSAIDSITRISNTASFAGLNLLNGELNYLTSGIDTDQLRGVNVFGAQFGSNDTIPIDIEVVASAQQGTLFVSGSAGGTTGAFASSVVLEIAGNEGVQTLNFASGTTYSAVITAVNNLAGSTGVEAELVNPASAGEGLTFTSTGYGDTQFVSVRRIGTSGEFFETYDQAGGSATERDTGRDVTAIVNGSLATAKGKEISVNNPSLSLELELSEALATSGAGTSSFVITGGGSTFQLGPSITATQQVGVGIRSVAASRVGGTTVNGEMVFLDSIKSGQPNALIAGSSQTASEILDNAITEISVLRGRLGAFERNTLSTNVRSLQIGFENISASESKIRDTDFAAEVAELTRAQILVQAGTSVLATSNSTSQAVLSLLQ